MKTKLKIVTILFYPVALLLAIVFVYANNSGGGGWITAIAGYPVVVMQDGISIPVYGAFSINTVTDYMKIIIPIFIAVLIIINGFILKWWQLKNLYKMVYIGYSIVVVGAAWLLPRMFFWIVT